MKFNQRPLFAVRRYDQLAVLASPVRQEIVDAIAAQGPCSVGDIAPRLGRTPESLYFHLRKLVAVGLVVQTGRRQRGGRDEAIYQTPGRRMVLDINSLTRRRREALVEIVMSSLRLVPRDVERGMREPDAVYFGPERTVYSARAAGWLTPARRARLAALFDEIEALMAESEPAPDATLSTVSLTLAPQPIRRSPRSRPVATPDPKETP